MTNDLKSKILNDAINKYGEDSQHDMVNEECAELIQAVNKFMRADKSADKLRARNRIREEVADVLIMIEQLKIMHSFTNKEIEQEIEYKLLRLRGRMRDSD